MPSSHFATNVATSRFFCISYPKDSSEVYESAHPPPLNDAVRDPGPTCECTPVQAEGPPLFSFFLVHILLYILAYYRLFEYKLF